MLSNEAEHFLLQLRLELMSRGKKDEDIKNIEEELRDHLIEAESRGSSIDSVTGGSVDEYINSISDELPFDKSLISFLFLMFAASLSFFIIPDLIRGGFDFSLYRLIYYATTILIGGPITIYFFKTILKKYGDQKITYIYGIIFFIMTTAIFVGMEFLLRKIDGPNIASLDTTVSLYIGLALTIIFIIVCIVFKNWFFIGVILYIILPDLVAKLITTSAPESNEYVTISTITFTILNIVIGTIAILYFKRTFDKEKKNADH